MSTAGPNIGGTAANRARSSNPSWVNPTNAQTENGVFATCSGGSGGTAFLDVTNLGWSGLSGLTITNLLVEAKAKVASGTGNLRMNLNDTSHTTYDGAASGTTSTTLAWVTVYNLDPPVGFDAVLAGNTDEYELLSIDASVAWSIDACRVTVTYTAAASGYIRLPLLGVGLINTLIHGLTLGLCSWRWRPFTRTQTRTAGVMA